LDGVIVFNPLAETDLESIVKLQIQELNRRFAAQKLGLTVALGRGTARAIARQTFAPEQGARGIRRFLQEQVEDPLTQKLMDNQLKPPAKITINFKDDKLTLV
jgi:ATP-dependent Clp protease ATP-binding subunit ClpB